MIYSPIYSRLSPDCGSIGQWCKNGSPRTGRGGCMARLDFYRTGTHGQNSWLCTSIQIVPKSNVNWKSTMGKMTIADNALDTSTRYLAWLPINKSQRLGS